LFPTPSAVRLPPLVFLSLLTSPAWCYVGKKRLEKGIALYKERHPDSNDTFSTTWFPFYLNPGAGKSIDKQGMYESKFGKERTAAIHERLSQIGGAEGINFKYGGRTGNTRDSHRLVQLGKTKSPQVQTRVIEELFASYFENEKDITSQEVLVEAGVKAGLEEKEVREWLESGKGGREVDLEVRDAVAGNISGVPVSLLFMAEVKWEGGADSVTRISRSTTNLKLGVRRNRLLLCNCLSG
jgi:predicted DsbA family dithiol-disulfide isomerase